MTAYRNPQGHFGVCGRNWEYADIPGNTLWKLARDNRLDESLAGTWPGEHVAIQGEAFGEGIQGNPLAIKGQRLAVFTIRVGGTELPRAQWPNWALDISVPQLNLAYPIGLEEALAQADSLMSKINPSKKAEGIVWRSGTKSQIQGPEGVERASFKVVSNKYLLKHDR